nr:reverse transcriptase domain-containing protein [Tanacetum cinerariifolium]
MAKMFLEKYFPPSMVTKLRNEITNFRQRPDESLFEAWERYKLSIDRCPNHNMLPVTQIDTFYNGLTLRRHDTINAAAGGTFMKRRPEECYDLIENMTTHNNDCDTSVERSESSSSITSSFDLEIVALKAKMAEIKKNLMKVLQINHQVKEVTPNYETYGGPHSYNDCSATVGHTQNVYAARANQDGNSYQPQDEYRFIFGFGNSPSNTITNPKEDLKGIITLSETAYQGPTIPTTSSSPPKVVERVTEVTNDIMPPTNNESTKDVQPSVVQTETSIPNSEPVIAPVIEPVAAPVSAPKPNQKPSIPYPGGHTSVRVFLNDDPSLPPMIQRNYMHEVRKELKICKAKTNKSSVDELPVVELKDLPPHLEYAFLKEEDFTPAVQHQRRVNPKIHDVIKQEVIKLLDAGLIYPISDSPWVSPVPKKGGFTVVENEDNELIPTRLDQEKTTFICPYRTFAYRHMPFGLCNAPGTFQRCMVEIFHDMIENTMEVFMDDFSVFKNSFQSCLSHLEKMLKRCEDTNLCLNWEKSHFMVKEGIILGHKISKQGIEVDKPKVDVISKLPHPTTVKGI